MLKKIQNNQNVQTFGNAQKNFKILKKLKFPEMFQKSSKISEMPKKFLPRKKHQVFKKVHKYL